MSSSRTYRPPSSHRERKQVPEYTRDRFKREVLGGRLWHQECQDAAKADITDKIPLHFPSVEQYIATFDPLVLEEAREGLKSDWAESCAGENVYAVDIDGIDTESSGWMRIKLRSRDLRHPDLGLLCRQGSVAVLSRQCPPQRNALDWIQSKTDKSTHEDAVGGEVSEDQEENANHESRKRHKSDQYDSKHSEKHHSKNGNGKDKHVNKKGLRTSPRSGDPRSGIVAGIFQIDKNGKAEIRIFPQCAVHADKSGHDDSSCCSAVVELLRSYPRFWWFTPGKSLTSSEREFEALHKVGKIDSSLMRHVLEPRLLQERGKAFEDHDVVRNMWPSEAKQPPFLGYLNRHFDYGQLQAIEIAACHLGSLQTGNPTLPFVLVQGPPGTGKTHTVCGILNVWHHVAYQRYYQAMLHEAQGGGHDADFNDNIPATNQQQALDTGASGSLGGESILESLSAEMKRGIGGAVRAVTQGAARPRILVCTPSNAACDELLKRVMQQGFRDGEGRPYFPNVVRVGAESGAVSSNSKSRLLKELVDGYIQLNAHQLHQRMNNAGRALQHSWNEVRALELELLRAHGEYKIRVASTLVQKVEHMNRVTADLERLYDASELLQRVKDIRQVTNAIEVSLMQEAEMVFTTLSSSQSAPFKALMSRTTFKTVLVDEAGQASEVATMQALIMGAERVVLVGDPRQLPATILSESAKAVAMERSLFERLEKRGCPVTMLNVQYRMHPSIRAFPSKHFYDNQLEDASSVIELPDEPYYSNPLMKPYILFDVARGKEQKSTAGGGSLGNEAEAEMAVGLFLTLQNLLHEVALKTPAGQQPPRTSVAIITPYRQQKQVLQRTFLRYVGESYSQQIAIETIDSYQGRQVDVVIFSCVRAGSTRGLGFVNDIRRLNVAITRARRALWILGSVATLRINPEWNALIQDAEERDLVIEDAHARNLFVNLDCWNRPPLQNHRHRIPTAETADNGLGAQRVAKKDSKEETDKKSFEVTGSTAGASPVADSKKKYLPPPSERR